MNKSKDKVWKRFKYISVFTLGMCAIQYFTDGIYFNSVDDYFKD
jgi:hypothetical protein